MEVHGHQRSDRIWYLKKKKASESKNTLDHRVLQHTL